MPRNVLIVEDDDVFATVLAAHFREAGFDVECVADGYAAIDRLRERQYSAVLLDLIIRVGLNGFGVLNYLDLEQPEVLDRVFLVTGMSEQTVMHAAPALMPRYFRKPLSIEALLRAVIASLEEAPAAPTPHNHVLIVEDDMTMAALLDAVLEGLGCTGDIAHSGRVAIERLNASRYHAIILDLLMFDVDGFVVLDYLEKCMPAMLPRTIVTTALPEKYRDGLRNRNIAGVISKPVDFAELRRMVGKCLKGEMSTA